MLVPSPICQQDLRCAAFELEMTRNLLLQVNLEMWMLQVEILKMLLWHYHLKSLHKLCYSLWVSLYQQGKRFASIADLQVGDGNQQAAVGTTVALLERGSRTMSAIHKRIYVSLKNEFKMLARVFKTYLPQEYPYDVVGGQRIIKQQDFDDRIDITCCRSLIYFLKHKEYQLLKLNYN